MLCIVSGCAAVLIRYAKAPIKPVLLKLATAT
jgi:hypothetical protein